MEKARRTELSEAERRNAMREVVNEVKVTIEHADCGKHEGILLDISRLGARLHAPYCFPCGSEVILHPPPNSGLRPSRVRIIRQHVLGNEAEPLFEYGVEFGESAAIQRHAWFLTLRHTP